MHSGGGEELWSYMNKDILPKEWGGKAGTCKQLNGIFIIYLYILIYN